MKIVFGLTFFIGLTISFNLSAQTANSSSEGKKLFMDIHQLVPGKVSFDAVSQAHIKDLATQDKYGVNFIRFWVDEKAGTVMCLVEAKDSASIVQTHKEAHGLLPDRVMEVKEGK